MHSFHHIYHSSFCSAHPIGKIHIIGDGSTEHDQSDVFRKHDNSFFPNHTPFRIIYVMNFVENDPLNISDHFCSSVKVVSENLSSHNDATSMRVHADITCDYTNRVKLFWKLSIFLIWKSFDWRSINNFSFMFHRQSNTILSYNSFTGTCVSRHKNTLLFLKM